MCKLSGFYTKHTLLHFFSVFYCAGQCHAVSISYVTAGRKAAGNPCNTDRKRFNQAGQVVCCRFAFCIGVCRNNDFFTVSSASLFKSSLILSCSGPIPSRGERTPWRTWYKPWYSWLCSSACTSWGCSTTQITDESRRLSPQISQGSDVAKLQQIEQ